MSDHTDLPLDHSSNFAHRIFDWLRRHSAFYLLSALMMLIGCYVVCFRYLFELKILRGPLVLLGIINFYELLVIFAAIFIMRHLRMSREGPLLVLIELFFLFDATFTINGCLPINIQRGMMIVAISAMLAMTKLFVLSSAVRNEPFDGLKLFLISALLFVYSFQPVLIISKAPDLSLAESIVCAVWMAFGALPLLILKSGCFAPDQDAAHLPLWSRAVFKKIVVVISLLLIGCQLRGQSWVHYVPFSWHLLFPLFMSLLTIYGVCGRANAVEVDIWRVAATVLILFFNFHETEIKIGDTNFALSPWRMYAAFAAPLFLLSWRYQRRAAQLDCATLLAMLAILGASPVGVLYEFVYPALPKVLACTALLLFNVFANGSWIRATFVTSVLVFWTLRLSSVSADYVSFSVQYARYLALSLFVLGLIFRRPGALRFCLVCAVAALGLDAMYEATTSSTIYFICVLIALSCARSVLSRFYSATLCTYVTLGLALRFKLPESASHINWGWLMIAAAFLLFGFGFWMTWRSVREVQTFSHEQTN